MGIVRYMHYHFGLTTIFYGFLSGSVFSKTNMLYLTSKDFLKKYSLRLERIFGNQVRY